MRYRSTSAGRAGSNGCATAGRSRRPGPAMQRRRSGAARRRSVAVVARLVRPLDRHAEVIGLLLGQLRQPGAELVEVQPRDLLVEVLGQHVDTAVVVVVVV